LIVALQVACIVGRSPVYAQDFSKTPIVIHGDKNYPPYESLVDGKPVGMNVDLWQEIANVLDRPLDFRLYQWEESQKRVKHGEGKVLSFMSFNKEREELYDFSLPTFSFKYLVFTHANKVDNINVANLTGKSIAVKKGGFPSTIVKALHPDAKIIFVNTPLDGFHKLLINEVDAVVEDEIVGYETLRMNKLGSIDATAESLSRKNGHIAVVKGNPTLVFQINEALKILKENGSFDRIADKWAGAKAVVISKKTIWFTLAAAFIVLVLLAAIAGIVYTIRVRKINIILNNEIKAHHAAEEQKSLAEKEARTDVLTGMHNRRAFLEFANSESALAKRHGRSCTCIMLDVDFFKKINDTYGHQVGDDALKAVANSIAKVIRTSDIAGRIGGEEFAIILPETTANAAKLLTERLRLSIANIVLSLDDCDVTFTASFGISELNHDDASIESAMSRADIALFEAKRQGRNRIVLNVS
jgi:diguanylate cyclase (GGDEF)-like protein